MNIQTTLDAWLEANSTTDNTSSQLKELTSTLGYFNIEEFFDDNSGCVDAIYDWVGKNGTEEWGESLKPVLRDDIQRLLDKKVIELEVDTNNRYILTNTRYAIVARFNNNGYLVGAIEILGESIALYDELDQLIHNSGDCDYLESFKHF